MQKNNAPTVKYKVIERVIIKKKGAAGKGENGERIVITKNNILAESKPPKLVSPPLSLSLLERRALPSKTTNSHDSKNGRNNNGVTNSLYRNIESRANSVYTEKERRRYISDGGMVERARSEGKIRSDQSRMRKETGKVIYSSSDEEDANSHAQTKHTAVTNGGANEGVKVRRQYRETSTENTEDEWKTKKNVENRDKLGNNSRDDIGRDRSKDNGVKRGAGHQERRNIEEKKIRVEERNKVGDRKKKRVKSECIKKMEKEFQSKDELHEPVSSASYVLDSKTKYAKCKSQAQENMHFFINFDTKDLEENEDYFPEMSVVRLGYVQKDRYEKYSLLVPKECLVGPKISQEYNPISDLIYTVRIVGEMMDEENEEYLGCGIGNVVIQVALQAGCTSYGVEIMNIPARLAISLSMEYRLRTFLSISRTKRWNQNHFSKAIYSSQTQQPNLWFTSQHPFC
ncbi:Histone-lysine N-methyltransferase, H3 lysine-79 specific [Zancudomyces culisetae]|uniref:Histone-lysine N-methyltransferase, H3 lysine-79 specific n=1 Tax=Zancudomyces culisetae TaxID=1213189 RepID=A0A1R1PYX6_ZANCU|nr:Histone-lysine N-methyltransferase, H3 lysine-79 specific [Zancudomyces culisetae]|eukprot:OMH86139.1 Histone-lysine N-methyltransferase, H3 lysine-79 specific [Zancudomyces culisetae]